MRLRQSQLFCLVFFIVAAAIQFTTMTRDLLAQDQNEKPIALSGFSISETYEIRDDQPLELKDPFLIRLLYRISKSSPKSRFEFARYSEKTTWQAITSKTEDHRCQLFRRTGQIRNVTVKPIPGAETDQEVRRVFVCECVDDQGNPFSLIALDVPSVWKREFDQGKLKLNEPIQFEGFLYGRASLVAGTQATPIFAANKIGWFPLKHNFDWLTESRLELSRAGFDLGLFDLAKSTNAKPLSKMDAEAFYQIIAKTRSATQIEPGVDFATMMNNAADCFGIRVEFDGVIRRCSQITTTDPDIQNRLGLERYYQVVVFPDLEGKGIVVRGKDGTEDVNHRFPVTVCFTELPDGATVDSINRQPCRISGYVYRFWRFQSDRTDQAGLSGQISPLVVCKTVKLRAMVNTELDGLLFGFIATVLVGVSLMIGFYRYSDRKHKSPGQKIMDELPDQINISSIESP